MRLGGKVTTESLGFDREAKHAEICARSRADILGTTRKTLGLGSLSLISLSPDLEAPPHSGSMPVAKPMGSNEEEEVGGALDHLACSSSLLPSFPCCCCPSLPWLSARSLAGSLLPMAVSTLLSAVSLKSWWR